MAFDKNPYEVLGVASDATPIEIKKAYKRLCLKHHPDKIQQKGGDATHDFAQIQFAYSVLSDATKRSIYDSTGLLDGNDDLFNWKEYFDGVNEKITIDMIDEDRKKYQELQEEHDDIWHNFMFYEGDFLKLFEVIPHLEFDEKEEARVFEIVEEEIKNNDVDTGIVKLFDRYKRSRKTKVKQMLKKLAKEAKEAAKLEKQIKDKDKKGRKLLTEDDLKSLIQSRQAGRLDALIGLLEQKYGKGKKRREPTDEEFEQTRLLLKKRR